MYITVTFEVFRVEFYKLNKNQFSFDALKELYKYYQTEDIELDVNSICCDWTEYSSLSDLLENYSYAGNSTNKKYFVGELSDTEIDEKVARLMDEYVVINLSNGHYLVKE